jgi:hypothetical protein
MVQFSFNSYDYYMLSSSAVLTQRPLSVALPQVKQTMFFCTKDKIVTLSHTHPDNALNENFICHMRKIGELT